MESTGSPSPPSGGMVTPEMIRHAYAHGAFPMAAHRDCPSVEWYTSNPRAVLPLDTFHIPHGLRRVLKKKPYVITMDRAFAQVIAACAQPRTYEQETWINQSIITGYTQRS
ncbi:MAG: hypothetical protein HC898_07490 [Phycisphaerales bacterium]|nr:hypothetical protein [Phycisphaerales bacterium]